MKWFYIMKKIVFLSLGMLIMMGSTPRLFAAANDIIDTSKAGSITIYKYDMTAAEKKGVDLSQFTATGKADAAAEKALADYAIKGVEFSYLRVGDVDQMSEGGKVKLIYEIPTALQTILGLAKADAAKTSGNKIYFTSQQINDHLAKALEDNTVTKDKLEEYMKNGAAMDETDASGVTSKDNLDLGLYLIVETKVPEDVVSTTNPFFVQLPMTDAQGDDWFYDVVCYPKNQTGVPTLEKKVRNNPDAANITTSKEGELSDFTASREEYTYADTVTATESETLDYELISKLPHITSTSTYLTTYTFEDVLTKGITYGKDAVIAIYDSKDAAAATNGNNVDDSNALAVWKSSDTDVKFKTEYGKNGNGDSTMKVSMTASGLSEINKKYSDKYIVIYYTATLNSNASAVLGDQGNPNDVSLTWKRTSTSYYDVLKDECIVYTFGLNMTKKFTDGKGDPTKVKFIVSNTSDGYFLTATGSNGVYYVTGKSATEEGATKFSPGADGSLKICGAEADTYALTETHSDAGYSLLKQPVIVKITSTKAVITPTEANITGTQSKSGNDSVANDGNVQGSALADQVSVQTTSAYATVDEKAAAMSKSGESANALVDMEITNSKGFLLPQTGGKGIYFMTVVGVLLAAAGASIMRKKAKK